MPEIKCNSVLFLILQKHWNLVLTETLPQFFTPLTKRIWFHIMLKAEKSVREPAGSNYLDLPELALFLWKMSKRKLVKCSSCVCCVTSTSLVETAQLHSCAMRVYKHTYKQWSVNYVCKNPKIEESLIEQTMCDVHIKPCKTWHIYAHLQKN